MGLESSIKVTQINRQYGELSYQGHIDKQWLDGNGHMNLGYYMVVFDSATGWLFGELGIGWQNRKAAEHSMFTLEAHITYSKELVLNQPFYIESRLIGFDHNKVQYIHWMFDSDTGEVCATNELLSLGTDMATRRSATFSAKTTKRLKTVADRHRQFPIPEDTIGRSVRQL
jgi:acyl-CoA thioester hydrolase